MISPYDINTFSSRKMMRRKKNINLGIFSVVFSVVLVAHFHQILHHQHDLVGNTQHQNHHVTNNNYEGHKQLILFALL